MHSRSLSSKNNRRNSNNNRPQLLLHLLRELHQHLFILQHQLQSSKLRQRLPRNQHSLLLLSMRDKQSSRGPSSSPRDSKLRPITHWADLFSTILNLIFKLRKSMLLISSRQLVLVLMPTISLPLRKTHLQTPPQMLQPSRTCLLIVPKTLLKSSKRMLLRHLMSPRMLARTSLWTSPRTLILTLPTMAYMLFKRTLLLTHPRTWAQIALSTWLRTLLKTYLRIPPKLRPKMLPRMPQFSFNKTRPPTNLFHLTRPPINLRMLAKTCLPTILRTWPWNLTRLLRSMLPN